MGVPFSSFIRSAGAECDIYFDAGAEVFSVGTTSMKLVFPDGNNTPGQVLSFTQDRLREFDVDFVVCPQPRCQCEVVTLKCSPRGSDVAESKREEPVKIDLAVKERRIRLPKGARTDTEARSLMAAIQREVTEGDWEAARGFYLGCKRRQTEEVSLDEVDAWFPDDVRDGAMAGYYEIFPYAAQVDVALVEERWIFDDLYCVQPGCHCGTCGIGFFSIASVERTPGPAVSFLYDYRIGKVEQVEIPAGPGVPSIADFLSAMRRDHPDFETFLVERQKRLQYLYEKGKDIAPVAPVRRASAKIGRNEPCPCGSGKKYKRCCAMS